VLGSISALIYRFQLSADPAVQHLGRDLLGRAEESLGAAMSIAQEAGAPELVESASTAFNHSLQAAGLAGGCFMLAVAVFVFFLTPKGTDVSSTGH
jgi:DHA2 family multidrug resistance protein-like MFS transporter